MPTKIFTTIEADCPFGKGVKIDSTACRNCPQYYRAGTGMFFWCRHPEPEPTPQPKKRGRPAGTVPKTKKNGPRTGRTVPKSGASVRKAKKGGF